MSWQTELEGPIWVPVLNAVEDTYAIPSNLLARVAYQESHFRPDIIYGRVLSPAGCIGLMQLNPRYFPAAGQDAKSDARTAGGLLASLYTRFKDWQVALAAYNWGGGNEHHQWVVDSGRYILADCPPETQDYVVQIVADVPVPGVLITQGVRA